MSTDSNKSVSLLNEHQQRRLLVTCQHVDKLLSDIEAILNASASKSPFPKLHDDISPVQRKVTQDYTARIRAQLVRVLESQGITHPKPTVNAIHAIKTILNFVDIAVEELKPKYMRGYGEIPEAAMSDLNGIAGELHGVVQKLHVYLAQGMGGDLQGHLERLAQTSDETKLLQAVERIVMEHGLVEFRTAIALIVDRLEEERFEIAFFGRVSTGKSSLLNYILQSPILPVGVNPITAVPTRIIYGPVPRLTIWFANREKQSFPVERLSEFATEQRNSANAKHVARINVELPSPRLRDGVSLVDTPGLGSLASAGASETLAYLPRCDLGVVLIDSGSTLTQEDLSTIQALYEASIPAFVLLSKTDLLAPADRAQALTYIDEQISSQLGLDLQVRAISTVGEHAQLLNRWFEQEIAPLYDCHQELARQSIKRKVGSLREAIEASLRARLERASGKLPNDGLSMKEVETMLRRTGGKLEEAHVASRKLLDEFPRLADVALSQAAVEVVRQWPVKDEEKVEMNGVVELALTQAAAEKAKALYGYLESLTQELADALDTTARELALNDAPTADELASVLKEMPRFDLGSLRLDLRFKLLLSLGKGVAQRRVEKELREQIGPHLSDSFNAYRRLLEAWTSRALEELGQRFNAHADWYRAQIERLAGTGEISAEEEKAIQLDLESLARWPTQMNQPHIMSSD